MKTHLPSIYLETTIPSYLTARASRDVILRGQQEATRRWWEVKRHEFRCFVSVFVEMEIARGDAEAAARRLEAVEGIPTLALSQDALVLAARILAAGLIPHQAAEDASHLAVATVHGMDFLLTWNCRHIHNVTIYREVRSLCASEGFQCPVICTPSDFVLPSLP